MKNALLGDCGCGRGDLGAVSNAPVFARRPTRVVNASLHLQADGSDEGYILPYAGTMVSVAPAPGRSDLVLVRVPDTETLYQQDGDGGLMPVPGPPAGTTMYGRAASYAPPAKSGGWGWLLLVAGAVGAWKSRKA